MAYEWQPHECDLITGIPFSKAHMARLEKDGVRKKFRTQEEVDWAWANGWYEPGRPETADVAGNPESDEETGDGDSDKWPENTEIFDMNQPQLLKLIEKKNIPGMDKRWGFERMRRAVVEFKKSLGGK